MSYFQSMISGPPAFPQSSLWALSSTLRTACLAYLISLLFASTLVFAQVGKNFYTSMPLVGSCGIEIEIIQAGADTYLLYGLDSNQQYIVILLQDSEPPPPPPPPPVDLYCGEMNCYDLLGVTRDSNTKEISKAYRCGLATFKRIPIVRLGTWVCSASEVSVF